MKNLQFLLIIAIIQLGIITPALAQSYEEGREWAIENGADSPADCYGHYEGGWFGNYTSNTPSFTEGCLSSLQDEESTNEDDNSGSIWGDQEDESGSDDSNDESYEEGF